MEKISVILSLNAVILYSFCCFLLKLQLCTVKRPDIFAIHCAIHILITKVAELQPCKMIKGQSLLSLA